MVAIATKTPAITGKNRPTIVVRWRIFQGPIRIHAPCETMCAKIAPTSATTTIHNAGVMASVNNCAGC